MATRYAHILPNPSAEKVTSQVRNATRFTLRSGDPWIDRIGSAIRSSSIPVHLVSPAHVGMKRLLEAVSTTDRPLMWIDYTSESAADETALGNRFVEAVNRATASKVLASGTPLPTATAAFSRLIGLLGPFTIAVCGGNRVVTHLRDLMSFHDGQNRVVLIDQVLSDQDPALPVMTIDGEQLKVTLQEAAWFADGQMPEVEFKAIWNEVGGEYIAFVDAVRLRLGLPPLWSTPQEGLVSLATNEFGLDPVTLAEVLVRKKRFVEAFELMCAQSPDLIPRYIDACGDAYFEHGLFDRFWYQMSQLESLVIENEKVIRWYYAAAMAVNRHSEVVPMIESYLRNHEAPELRAQYAASRPSKDFLIETKRAVDILESPITLRHYAFALSLSGLHDEAFEALQRALRLADVLGNDQLVVAIGTDMCIALQRVGAFQESLWWGDWACREYTRRDLKENYRRISGLAALAFSKMLVGDEIGLRELIEDIEISTGLVGVPSYEGVVTTVADFLSITGHAERAAELYELIFETATYDIAGLIAVDFVRCLVDLGWIERAVDVGDRVFALSRAASQYQRDCGTLARGIALKGANDTRAKDVLSTALEAFMTGTDAVRLCQASIQLAELCLSSDDVDGARLAVSKAGNRLVELGDTGWRLLGGAREGMLRVRDLVASTPAGLSLCVLGEPAVTLFAEAVVLTSRQLELIAVLANAQTGLSLDQLAIQVYGDRAVSGTTKAAVSRLRSEIPLTSRPYKIGVPYRADFLDLLEHLKRGRVRQGLTLYRGPLLPLSEAPAIVSLRDHIDESLRQAVLSSGDAQAMLELANRTDVDDLELLEEAFRHLPKNDPQSPLLRARIRQIRRDWGADGRLDSPSEW